MKTTEFHKPVSSAQLNESMFKKFGSRINFDKYTREELENYRNLLRTKVDQAEKSSQFNELLDHDSYQKDKFVLNLLNTRIKEMLGENKKQVSEKITKKTPAGEIIKDFEKSKNPKFKGKSKEQRKKQALGAYYGMHPEKSKKTKTTKEALDPVGREDDDVDNDGKKNTKSDKYLKNRRQARSKAIVGKKKVKESRMARHYKIIIEGLQQFIREDEEGKAKDITAGTDMVNDFTSWMQRVGQYQTKTMIELADSIRSNFGQAEADAFKTAVQPALEEALSSLTQSRETITRAVAVLAGEEGATPMGMDSEMEPEIGTGMGMEEPSPDSMNEPMGTDEFGASDAAVGGAETSGREMRESREQRVARRLAEEHSIISKLAR